MLRDVIEVVTSYIILKSNLNMVRTLSQVLFSKN